MPNRSGKSAAAFIGKAARFLQLIRFLLGFMQINYARMQQTGQPFLSCPVLLWDLCSSHFCITSSSRCNADDGVNPMETVRLMLYRFLFIIIFFLIHHPCSFNFYNRQLFHQHQNCRANRRPSWLQTTSHKHKNSRKTIFHRWQNLHQTMFGSFQMKHHSIRHSR